MTASEARLMEYIAKDKHRFVIPIYQRNYDWDDYQCSQLLKDIREVNSPERVSHFIGSIVFIHDGLYTTAKIKELIIIDGQQRLTTVSLLLIALYQFAKENGQEEVATEILETYLINRFARDGKRSKLWPSQENSVVYTHLLNGVSDETESFTRMRENYERFRLEIDSQDAFNQLYDGLQKLSFVEISLERGKDDPQRIFESLNSTGLALSQADLIRNFVLMGHEREQQEVLFDKYWNLIEEHARDDDGRVNLVSDFVRDFLTLKNKKIPRKDAIYEQFKLKYEKLGDQVEPVLQELLRYARQYGKLVNPTRESNSAIRRELHYLKMLKVNTSYPFMMRVYDDYERERIDRQTFIDVLKLVQSFVTRRFIVGLPTNALNKIFMRLYDDIRQDDYLPSLERSLVRMKGTQRFPDDKETKKALREKDIYNIKSSNRLYLLDRIENHKNREPVSFEHLTTEHIFPQNPNKEWKQELSEEDYELMSDAYLHQLGNLTLSGNNGSLGNVSFLRKRDMNYRKGEQGYAFSNLWLNGYLKVLDHWDVEAFKSRHKRMIGRAMQVWEYPEVNESMDMDTREELTIFEVEDPTGYQVEYATFGGRRIEPRSVKEFYVEVLSWMFAQDPHPMKRPEVAETVYLEHTKDGASRNDHIGNNYVVDTANSSRVKFDRLQTVLTAYDMDKEVLVKLG